MTDAELGELVFLGHGNREEYNDHTHKTFAKDFRKKFELIRGTEKKEKEKIKHVYLVGCELGTIDANGDSLAQKIAAELAKIGFKNLIVHAVAAIQGSPQDILTVEVITKAGWAKLTSNFKLYRGGAVDVPLMLEGNISAHIENGGELRLVVNGADPRYELNKPANTFGPKKEKLEARLKRVEEQSVSAENFSRAEAIALLYSRKEYLRSRGVQNGPKAKVLEGYIAKLNEAVNVSDDDWHSVMKEVLNTVRTNDRLYFRRQGATEQLILNLSNRKYNAVERLVERQSDREQASKRGSDATQAKVLTTDNINNVGWVERSEAQQAASTARVDELPADVQEEIKNLIAKLKAEIKVLSQGCPGFFKTYERNTKNVKLAELSKFFDNNGVSVTRERAYEIALAASQDKRVMRSSKTSRTSQIVNHILNTQERVANPASEAASSLLVSSSRLRKRK